MKPIEFPQLCRVIRSQWTTTVDDSEWVERVKMRIARLRFACPDPERLTRALRAVERTLEKELGHPRPLPLPAPPTEPTPDPPPLTFTEAKAALAMIYSKDSNGASAKSLRRVQTTPWTRARTVLDSGPSLRLHPPNRTSTQVAEWRASEPRPDEAEVTVLTEDGAVTFRKVAPRRWLVVRGNHHETGEP